MTTKEQHIENCAQVLLDVSNIAAVTPASGESGTAPNQAGDGAVFFRCSCGKTYSQDEFGKLHLVGYLDQGPDYPRLEMRNCCSCNSTGSVEEDSLVRLNKCDLVCRGLASEVLDDILAVGGLVHFREIIEALVRQAKQDGAK